jgi:transcriptional regulator with XRE-family HTH domain
VASRAKLSVPFLADIEHDRTRPTLDKLQRLAQVFGLDVRGLLEGVRPYGTGGARRPRE